MFPAVGQACGERPAALRQQRDVRDDENLEQTVVEPELSVDVVEPPALPPQGTAVEFDVRVPPSGEITLVASRQRVGIHQALAGRTLTVWANHRSVHFLLDGHPVTTVPSRLRPEDIAYLTMRYGAHPAGPEPAPTALPRTGSGTAILAAGKPVEADRKVLRDGIVCLAGGRYQVEFALAGRTVTLRLDGHLMHAIADNALRGTWPCPVPADRLGQISGARTATSPLPPPPLPAEAVRAQRKVHASGRFMINGQLIKLGPWHAGKVVTVVIEDTHYRILHGEDELAGRPRKNPGPITMLYVKGMGTQKDRQGSPETSQSPCAVAAGVSAPGSAGFGDQAGGGLVVVAESLGDHGAGAWRTSRRYRGGPAALRRNTDLV